MLFYLMDCNMLLILYGDISTSYLLT